MRDLFVTLFVLGSLPACFRRPYVGLLVFSVLAYMRLQDLTWGFARFERWSYYVALVTAAGYLSSRERGRPIVEARTVMMAMLAVIVGVGLLLAKGARAVDWNAYVEYGKILTVAIFTTVVVRDRRKLRMLVWVIAMSFAFYGVKSGIQGILSLGRLKIQRGPGGMLEDNNDFALALTMAVPLLVHLATSEKRALLRRTVSIMVPLTMITVVLTHSRGAALSMGFALAILVWRSRNRLAGFSVMGMLALAALALAPDAYFERLQTIRNWREDGSAMGRIAAWKVAGNMIRENPVFGVGLDRFRQNYASYDYDRPPGLSADEGTRVAHNSYLQIWAECGTPAFLLYMGLLALTLIDLWRVRKQARRRYHRSWILSYCTMFEASTLAFMCGSMFLNRAHFDLIYHYVAIVLVFGRIARAEMRALDAGPTAQAGTRRAGLAHAARPGFARRSLRPNAFRNTPLAGAGR